MVLTLYVPLLRCGLIHSLTLLDECRRSDGIDLPPFYDDCMEDACAGQTYNNSTIMVIQEKYNVYKIAYIHI